MDSQDEMGSQDVMAAMVLLVHLVDPRVRMAWMEGMENRDRSDQSAHKDQLDHRDQKVYYLML